MKLLEDKSNWSQNGNMKCKSQLTISKSWLHNKKERKMSKEEKFWSWSEIWDYKEKN